ncbi:MAG: fibro-slime domain-containing protein [Nitrosomonas sp.]|uniref:fibro-slime domain-containing protein n=1 Tax=Nitrosomonas sp. TaxID=42353 RepID=UPI0025D7247D|nr:fibro-slime domain-containing protein [Nitrosomonas sp.]UJP01765.1 MAG: fibro-slime domain-containing protein [Nitrosomonas sp.]
MIKRTLFFTVCSASLLAGMLTVTSIAKAASTTLTGTVRDFSPGALVPGSTNPDFESGVGGVVHGMVDSALTGSAPTPILFGAPGYITSSASFAEWYGSAAPSMPYSITLNETFAGSGIYSYSDSSFFPIDGLLLGNYGSSGHNFHFTYQIHSTFDYIQGAGQTFNFSGDDDVWVYFDNKLGIDLGGVHSSASQSVNLDTLFGPGKSSGTYSFDFFFAERHTSESNFTITTSLALIPAVPEPETYAMLLAGLGLLGFMFRQRKEVAI